MMADLGASWRYDRRGRSPSPKRSRRDYDKNDDRDRNLWRDEGLPSATDLLRNGLSYASGHTLDLGMGGNLGLGLAATGAGGYFFGTGLGPLADASLLGQGGRLGAYDLGLVARPGTLNLTGTSIDQDSFRATEAIPADASDTLFVDGLPSNCTRREAARILQMLLSCWHFVLILHIFKESLLHIKTQVDLTMPDIFRPFIGFKEVRVVHKDAKRTPGEKVVLCFVEFADARCAATALEALQGYKFDEKDPDSYVLRLSFARYPGPRGGPPPRARSPYRSPPRGRDRRR